MPAIGSPPPTDPPAPPTISSSARVLDARANPIGMQIGSVSGFRYRGGRLSKTFISIIESFISDTTAIQRRLLLSSPFGKKPQLLLSGTSGAGIYGTNDQDTRLDPYIDGILNLQPIVSQLNIIRIQSLRQQLQYKLSTLS